jgi:tetratricopeptide (TPR) repeat protein
VSPSIFFVNCCNLGKIDAAAEDKARQEVLEGRPELAASVAVQLIRLGVRCVIVAGWEVDDDGASTFGQTFYQQMLDGASFGEATLRARKATYAAKPNSNTWGAFQCYGDPDYRLRIKPVESAAADDAEQFVGVSEAIAAAEQISSDLNVGLERDPQVQRKRLVRIENETKRKGWLKSALLCTALAEARAELGDFPEAIEYYAAAVSNENASFKLRAIEQLANLRARNAVREFRAAPTVAHSQENAIAAIRESLRVLKMLTEAVGQTPERLSLQAGCWKRLAQVQASCPAADAALAEMKKCCEVAAALGGKDPEYPRSMACNAEICGAVRGGIPCEPAVSDQLRRMLDRAGPDEADFWKLIRSADVRMNLALMQESVSAQETDEIRQAYRRAWQHTGSPVKMRSVTEQLEFYEDIFSGGSDVTASTRTRLIAWIGGFRDFIETEFLAEQSQPARQGGS